MSIYDQITNDEEGDRGAFEVLPVDRYLAKITNAMVDMTTTPIKLSIEYTIEAGGYKFRKLFQNFTFSEGNPKNVTWLRWQLGILGIAKECTGPKETADAAMSLVNKTIVKLDLTHREFDGKTYPNVKIDSIVQAELREGQTLSDVVTDVTTDPRFDSNENIPF